MRQRTQAEIDYRSLEWTRDTVLEWIATNEQAQAIQSSLPPSFHDFLRDQPEGLKPLAASMATRIHPDSVREAHVILSSVVTSLEQLLNGSLSHPFVRLDHQGPSDEKTETVVGGDDLAGRVAELEAENRDLRNRLLMIYSMSAPAASDVAEGADQGVPRVA